jgi:hypothetical protein
MSGETACGRTGADFASDGDPPADSEAHVGLTWAELRGRGCVKCAAAPARALVRDADTHCRPCFVDGVEHRFRVHWAKHRPACLVRSGSAGHGDARGGGAGPAGGCVV